MGKRKSLVSALVCLLLAFLASFVYLFFNGFSRVTVNSEPKKGQIRIACVGDSITYGSGIKNWPQNNYPMVLQELLGEKYHVANFGSGGTCVNPEGDSPYANKKNYYDSLDYNADVLVFMMGTNDSKIDNWTNAETFISQYKILLDSYIEAGHTPEVYLGLCAEAYCLEESDSGVAKFNIQPAVIDEIVIELELFADESEYPMTIIDIHTLTELHPEWFARDGIHPNNEGAAAIAQEIYTAILGIR